MSEMEKICSCFGHYNVDITDDLKKRTTIEVEKAIKNGFQVFLFGGRSNFDDLVYEIVSDIKSIELKHEVKRVFCFPLYNQIRKPPHWYKRKEYEALECPTKDFDWWYTSIYYRNCAMIDQSDLVLFYAKPRENSGAYKTYKYAVKKHKKIINFAEKTE